MSFEKITSGEHAGKYRSPSGKIWTEQQMRAYYATDKFKADLKVKSKKRKT